MDELIRILIEKHLSLSCIDFPGIDFASHLGIDNDDIYKGSLTSSHQLHRIKMY
ncbi:MAG: hypothetical protein LUF02_02935 [Erysipelotrichaceae bacterium]|nr:hypothetical protein [Erysipelotrichaceae bacterium]